MPDNYPGVSGAFIRNIAGVSRLVFRDGLSDKETYFPQGAEFNEMHNLLASRIKRAGELSAQDGDRIFGADILVDTDAGTVLCTAGEIYASGDVRTIAAATLNAVPMVGEVAVGVRLVTGHIDEITNPDLAGFVPGALSEGEPGAVREIQTLTWGFEGDGADGDLFPVYRLVDGVALDQTAPVELSTTNQAISAYDRDANGSYVVSGCKVAALGLAAGKQAFVISAGVANINGFKRTRSTSLRIEVDETWDVSRIDAELHTFADGGSGTVTLEFRHTPLATLVTALVEKEITETVTHGGAIGSIDALANDSVTEIVSVTQGATTFVVDTDYVLNGDSVDWTPGGDEPATGSTYDVTYRYLDAVTPDETTPTTVTLSGGRTGGEVQLTYDYKLPRTDLICLTSTGQAAYLLGVSSRTRPVAPAAPESYLPLAQVKNNFVGAPTIVNTGIRAYTMEDVDRIYNRLVDLIDLVALERLRRDIDSREPVAKRGVFVDPFTSDRYRDAGVQQDAAVFDGSCQLAIDATVFDLPITGPKMLVHDTEVLVSQTLATRCMKINPYRNFSPLPGAMVLSPPVDHWVEIKTEWTSAVTQTFGAGNQSTTTTVNNVIDERTELAEFLRAIDIDFTITGFGSGEILDTLTFDGLDVTPSPALAADGSGQLTGTISIAAETVPAGSKPVVATGLGGTVARALFVGEGTITTTVMQQITTVTRWGDFGVFGGGGGGWGPNDDGSSTPGFSDAGLDPLGQTFSLPFGRSRQLAAVNLSCCAKGDETNPIILEIRTVENGLPTPEIRSQVVVNMAEIVVGSMSTINLPNPVWLDGTREWCIVIKNDDPDHSLSIAGVGDFDAVGQQFVAQQPYTVGVLISSSNARTWTAHQNDDLTFELLAATYSVNTRTVDLGTIDLVDCSDLLILATVEIPTAACSVVFEIERPGGEVIRMVAGQVVELDDWITETVQVRAVLSGSTIASPTLFPGAQLIAGSLRDAATYVSRAFKVDGATRIPVNLKELIPSGATAIVELQDDSDTWHVVPVTATEVLEVTGWTDRTHEIEGTQPTWGAETRVRLSLTGSPSARPSLADLRAATI